MQYTIARTDRFGPADARWERPVWALAQTLEITHFPWKDSGHRPRVQARLLYDETALGLIFRVEDRYVRAVAQKFQDSVCTDSCVEFFVAPVPGSAAYFNFEVNCGGTMLVYRCPSPEERQAGKEQVVLTAEDEAAIPMAHSLPRIVEPEIAEPTTWTIEYHLPFALFDKYFGVPAPRAGTTWRANFYKCADRTSHPHWGSWAPVDTPRPNFHVPASFQPLLFG
jgi:hypothetical protein